MSDNSSVVGRHVDVSRETIQRLETYVSLLRKWNPKINLVSASSLQNTWTRHISDSAQILRIAPAKARTWADLGSGGGFPGAVVGIIAAELRPQLSMILVEADQRKSAFLRTVSRETGVPMEVVTQRIERLDPLTVDVISARALAPLPSLLRYAEWHLAPGGTVIFLKGAGAMQEVEKALETWRFDCESLPSQTDKDAVILKIGGIERV